MDANGLARHELGANLGGLLLGNAVDDVSVLRTLVDIDGAVGILAILLEVGLVVLRTRQGKIDQMPVTGNLDPIGLVIAAGIAGKVGRKLDGSALGALARPIDALFKTRVELLDHGLHIFELHENTPYGKSKTAVA